MIEGLSLPNSSSPLSLSYFTSRDSNGSSRQSWKLYCRWVIARISLSSFFIIDTEFIVGSLINMLLEGKSSNHGLKTIADSPLWTTFTPIGLNNHKGFNIKIRDSDVLTTQLAIDVCDGVATPWISLRLYVLPRRTTPSSGATPAPLRPLPLSPLPLTVFIMPFMVSLIDL
ncbi:unnamed protein product [Phytophthora lilii]|uniref:Unnamed protein product n=1 Tax=Phytophthora lilii TaxID=2077276 RepID=A0A9W6WRL0_9STRA|nr:unnamed protein product [Phytophthora lilii]